MMVINDGPLYRCDVCHEDAGIPCLVLTLLVDNPHVCMQCVAQALGLKRVPYKAEVLIDFARRRQPWKQRLKNLWEGRKYFQTHH